MWFPRLPDNNTAAVLYRVLMVFSGRDWQGFQWILPLLLLGFISVLVLLGFAKVLMGFRACDDYS